MISKNSKIWSNLSLESEESKKCVSAQLDMYGPFNHLEAFNWLDRDYTRESLTISVFWFKLPFILASKMS